MEHDDCLNLAVVGAGLIGRRHIEVVRNSPQCALSSIVDPSADARAFAADLSVAHHDSLDAVLGATRPDGVILATPNQLHAAQGLACIAAGMPALIEKPVADTVEDGNRLLAAAEAVDARILVGHHRRYSAIISEAIEVIESGALGDIVAVVGTALFYKAESEGYFDGPFAWRRRAGGGPILINLIHEIGNLRAMVGEIVAVQALTSNNTRGFEVEDTAAIGLRFANGALGTFMLSDTAASSRSWEHTSGEDR